MTVNMEVQNRMSHYFRHLWHWVSLVPATASRRAASVPRCAGILASVVFHASVSASSTVGILHISISSNIPTGTIGHIIFSIASSTSTSTTPACIIAAPIISICTASSVTHTSTTPRTEIPTSSTTNTSESYSTPTSATTSTT
ncbi:hypothetical protein V1478_001004 [Vespula squamosa]|uniref:Uncharacterized protein n=1 Tax=Vespula squamosa TaxID=30214 RepID=A0ABD2C733_VESSQ